MRVSRSEDGRDSKRLLSLLVVAAFGLISFAFICFPRLPAQAQAALGAPTPTPRPRDTSVGANCRACHAEIVASFQQETHGKSAKFLKDTPDDAKCDSCHGDPTKHIANRKANKAEDDIQNPEKLKPGQTSATCLQCHSRDHDLFSWDGGRHDTKGMSCLSCHSVHHSRSEQRMLSRASADETCVSCHKEQRKALFQRSNHFFRTENGVKNVGCTSCHNPHGGEGRKMLVEPSVNSTCYRCHADKRGPFLWEHAPVQENCMTCHTPHGSNNAKLLVTRTHQMCQECHINILARHQTANGFDVFTFNRSCVNCHSQIHGSNHPSGKGLVR